MSCYISDGGASDCGQLCQTLYNQTRNKQVLQTCNTLCNQVGFKKIASAIKKLVVYILMLIIFIMATSQCHNSVLHLVKKTKEKIKREREREREREILDLL